MAGGTVRPIVVGVDGTPESQLALRWATEEAKVRGLPVRVISVYEWPPTPPLSVPLTTSHGSDVPPTPEANEAARRAMDEAYVYVRDQIGESRVSGAHLTGRPAAILVAESTAAELLVVGSRSRSALASVMLGSVSSPVAAHADCPVVVVRIGRTGPAAQRIVVGVDGSEESLQALAFGFEEAALRDAPLEVVHCWQPSDDTPQNVEREREERREALRQQMSTYEQKQPNVDVTTEVVEGRPVALLAVRSWSAQLVVIGSRGHGGLVGLLLGSVSEGLLHHAHCSVAVVRRR